MTRRQFAYQAIGGLLGGAIGFALSLLVTHLAAAGAPWGFFLAMILCGGATLAGLAVGNRIWLRREYGKGE